MKIVSDSHNTTLKIARHMARYLQKGDIICLSGQLGAGKTVFVKGIAFGLGGDKNDVTSPTFILIQEYNKTRLPLYHFDLYRLDNIDSILDLGYEEYFYGQGVSVIEWADRLGCLEPHEFLKIEFTIKKNKKRLINFLAVGQRYKFLVKKIKDKYAHIRN